MAVTQGDLFDNVVTLRQIFRECKRHGGGMNGREAPWKRRDTAGKRGYSGFTSFEINGLIIDNDAIQEISCLQSLS